MAQKKGVCICVCVFCKGRYIRRKTNTIQYINMNSLSLTRQRNDSFGKHVDIAARIGRLTSGYKKENLERRNLF